MTINWLHWISSSFVSWFTEPKSEISPPTILTSGDHAPFIFDCLIQVDLQVYIFQMVWSEYFRAPAQIWCFRNVSKPHLLGRSPSPSIPHPSTIFSQPDYPKVPHMSEISWAHLSSRPKSLAWYPSSWLWTLDFVSDASGYTGLHGWEA